MGVNMLVKFKLFFLHLYEKFKTKGKWLFPVFLLVFMPNVKATNLGPGLPLTYGNSTYAYNWTSSSNFTGLTIYKSNGYDGGVYYVNPVTTGTNGISFGQFFNGMLLKNHYYRITWVGKNNDDVACSEPASWANQLRFGTGMYGSSIVTKTSFKYIGVQQNVTVFIDDPDATYNHTACAYTIVISLGADATFANFPFNTSSTLNSSWFYYGYYIEDIGSTSEVTQSELNNAISSLQSSLNSSISSQTNSINGNIDQEFNDLKNQDHTYTNNANDTPSGQSDINSTLSKQNTLSSNLNLNTNAIDISYNANSSNFIWYLVDGIRSIDPIVPVLITTLLSIGIIKFVLGR